MPVLGRREGEGGERGDARHSSEPLGGSVRLRRFLPRANHEEEEGSLVPRVQEG